MTQIPRRLPVLFVHGHNFANPQDTDFNYQQNWQDQTRLSFKPTLENNDNAGLDIEDYYIRFENQGRSISEDATDISDAIDLILHRHDPSYAYPHVSGQTSLVKVVIIAYSKGTLSTRLYLKSLQVNIAGMPAARPGFNPISEFIAIAPPNHGIVTQVAITCAGQQMTNGRRPSCEEWGVPRACGLFPAGGLNFITNLNTPDEAPGSRDDTNNAGAPTHPIDGTLYVTIFANAQHPDFVGGLNDPGGPAGCESRPMAANRSSNADNIPVAIAGSDETEVHRNTPHTAEVICLALSAAVRHRSPVGQTCAPNSSGVPVIPLPPRAAAMLTLDFSSSMSALACPGCATRAEVLKDAVELFIQLWSAVGVSSDRIGVNYFRTNVEPFDLSGDPLPVLSAGGPAIIADLGNQGPRGNTAMGNGLQRAIEILRDSAGDAQERRVLLFTDGMQNVNPMARIRNGQLEFFNQARRPNSNISPTAPAALDSGLDIAVDTIGIGEDAALVGLLNEIASETGGRPLVTSAPDNDLRRFFIEQLINALRGFSPQLVAYRHGTLVDKDSTEAFAIENGPRKLVLKVSWKRGQTIDFSVTRDGVDVTSAGHFINGAFYKIFVIEFPARGTIAARGNWRIRVKGKAGTAYEAAAIVDGGRITYDAIFNAQRLKVGHPLDLVVRLTAGGQPIDTTARVMVSLMSPTTALRRATPDPRKLPVFEPGMTVAERQSLAVAQDPRTWATLKPRQQRLLLKRTDKGDFRARFRPQVPGIYTALVTIEGESDKLGQFSRTMTVTTVVRRKDTSLIRR